MLLRRAAATGLVIGLVVGLGALAGCEDGDPETAGRDAESPRTSATPAGGPAYPTYVALGDSYTAAPGVPQTEQVSGCFRSSGNYPALVAAELGSEYVDVSCSGATTLSLVGSQTRGETVIAPQFAALAPDTSLVTLGMGGNDLDLFQTLVGTCGQLRSGDPDGAPCRAQMATSGAAGGDALLEKVAAIQGRVRSAVEGVHDRAPSAEVVVVGYPQVVPPRGTCGVLPLARGDYAYVRSVTTALNDALRTAAEQGGATFVDVAAASRGHDVCAGADAWVNGSQTDLSRAIAFHPFAEEQQAVADLVVAGLRGS